MKVNGQEFITIKEMSKILGVPANTIKQRLFQKNIKPISKDALYEISVLEIIKSTTMGRPKNLKTPDKEKYAKPAKGKKEKTPPRK